MTSPTWVPGRHTLRLRVEGRERLAVVHVPRRGGDQQPPPLVLTMHGSGSGPLEQLRMSGFDVAADRHGFVVAAPQGATRSGAGFAWDAAADVPFLLALTDALATSGYADPERLFATGLSGGGRLACDLAAAHPQRVAGIGVVAGLRAPAAPERRLDVPVLAVHGTADPVNPFGGGGPAYWGNSVPTAFESWARANGCTPAAPTERRLSAHVTQLAHPSCAGAETVLYVVEAGGHTWPGSPYPFPPALGPVSDELDATETIWRFLAQRPVARRASPTGT